MWRLPHTLGAVALIIVGGLAGRFLNSQLAILAVIGALLLLFILIGFGITGHWKGAWIDERNKMTLSRFQLIVWTIVVLGAWFTAVLQRMGAEGTDPLAVAIPEELWWLMGISTASLVGSPLILSAKKTQRPDLTETEETLTAVSGQDVEVKPATESVVAGTTTVNQTNERVLVDKATNRIRAIGTVEFRPLTTDASWADFFRGDETGNAAWVDVGKVQMFLFTLVLVAAYSALLYQAFASGNVPSVLPAVPESMVTLLAISHAGYLATKAVSHSGTRP